MSEPAKGMGAEQMIEWIEPFGPHDEPVYMRVPRSTAIAKQREVARKAKGYEYPTDEMAVDDFITVNWAYVVAQPWREFKKELGTQGERPLTRHSQALDSFTDYCRTHPNQRFWQALRNWSDFHFIVGLDGENTSFDTFNLEGLAHVRNAAVSGASAQSAEPIKGRGQNQTSLREMTDKQLNRLVTEIRIAGVAVVICNLIAFVVIMFTLVALFHN